MRAQFDLKHGLAFRIRLELRGYETIMERLTPSQSTVLRAIADDPHAKVFSIDFTSRVSMPASSVRRVITRLVDDRLVYFRKDAYRFSNPFFREWIRRA